MAEEHWSLPPPQIDLQPFLRLSLQERDEEVQQLLRLGKCAGSKSTFELQDLAGKCARQYPQGSANAATPYDVLQRYRESVIRRLVLERRDQLPTAWSDAAVEKLIGIIAHYGHSVPDLAKLRDGLVSALRKNGDGIDVQQHLVLSAVWVILYNLRAAHRQLVRGGHKSIFGKDWMDRFVQRNLAWLENGAIRITRLGETFGEFAGGMYSPQDDTLSLPDEFFSDPLLKAQGLSAPLELAVPHELFHAWQDANKERLTLSHAETNAEIFGLCALLLTTGYQAGLLEMERIENATLKDFREAKNEDDDPVRKLFHQYVLEKLSVEIRQQRTEIFPQVEREMMSGKKDVKARQAFTNRYLRERVVGMVGRAIAGFSDQIRKAVQEHGEEAVREGMDAVYRQSLDPSQILLFDDVKFLHRSDVERYKLFVEHGIMRLHAVFFAMGAETVGALMEIRFMPAMLDARVLAFLGQQPFRTDGIPARRGE